MRRPHNQVFLLNLTFLLCFFPFFVIIPIGNSETQPLAAIAAGFYLLTGRIPKFLQQYAALFLSIIFFYFLVDLAQYFLNSSDISFILAALQSFLIFITPLLIFVALFDNLHLISVRVFRFCLYSWLTISVLQQYFSTILSSTGISAALAAFIPRFSEAALGGARGVAAFSPEPSYAAQIIIGIFAFTVFLYRNRRIKKSEYCFMICSCIFMSFLNLSATIGAFLAAFLAFYLSANLTKSLWKLLTRGLLNQNIGIVFLKAFTIGTVIYVFFILLNLFVSLLPNSRISDLFNSFSSLSYQNFNVFSVLNLTNDLGSQRSISVYVGYFNVFNTYGLGSGLGSWSIQFLNALEDSGLDPSRISFFTYNGFIDLKPYAYGALVAFDMGMIGLVSMSSIFISTLR